MEDHNDIKYQVNSPLGSVIAEEFHTSKTLPDLNGKTICEVTNGGFRSEFTFPIIREMLLKRYSGLKIIPYDELPIQWNMVDARTMLERVENTVKIMKDKGCDAVITGNGG